MSGKRSRRERQIRAGKSEGGRPNSDRRRITAAVIIALAAAAAAIVAVVAFAGRGKVEKAAAPVRSADSGQASGPFQTVLASGTQFTSRDLGGKPTVAAFVIEDCTSCVNTLHTLAALSKDGVRTLAVNVNVPPGSNPIDAAKRLASFAANVNGKSGILYAADPGQRTAAAFGVRQIESYLIFDARGREVGHGVALSPNQIRRALKQV